MEIVPERCGIEGRGVGMEGGEGSRTHTGEGFIRIESGLPDGSSGSERAEQGEKCLVADARNAGEGEKPGGVRKSLMVGDDIHACFGHHTRYVFHCNMQGGAYGQVSGFGYTIGGIGIRKRAHSSFGRAPALHAGGERSESAWVHHP